MLRYDCCHCQWAVSRAQRFDGRRRLAPRIGSLAPGRGRRPRPRRRYQRVVEPVAAKQPAKQRMLLRRSRCPSSAAVADKVEKAALLRATRRASSPQRTPATEESTASLPTTTWRESRENAQESGRRHEAIRRGATRRRKRTSACGPKVELEAGAWKSTPTAHWSRAPRRRLPRNNRHRPAAHHTHTPPVPTLTAARAAPQRRRRCSPRRAAAA